ncbi:MAG: hypothetical protein ABSH29_25410 [Acidimicrobiales bacterium]|jgi:hypothetical protein
MQSRSTPSAGNNRQWSPATSHDQASRRAAGRRRYNARRKVKAILRRRQIIEMWRDLGKDGWSPFDRGGQAMLADFFHVNRSTICRDMAMIKRMWQVVACPTCDSVLSIDRIDDLEERGRIKVTQRP